MPRIMNSTTLSTDTMKMTELRKGYLLNGQYYLKDSFNPVPFQSAYVKTYLNGIGLNKSNNQAVGRYNSNNDWVKSMMNSCIDRIIYDNDNDDKSFIFCKSDYHSFIVYTIEERDNNIEILNKHTITIPSWKSGHEDGSWNDFAGYLGQDIDYVYFAETGVQRYSSYNYCYGRMHRIDKKNGTVASVMNYPGYGTDSSEYRTGIYPLHEDIHAVCHSRKAYLYKRVDNTIKTITSWDITAGEKVAPAIKMNLDGSGTVYCMRNDGFMYKTTFDSTGTLIENKKLEKQETDGSTLTYVVSNNYVCYTKLIESQGNEYLVNIRSNYRGGVDKSYIQVSLLEDDSMKVKKEVEIQNTWKNCVITDNAETVFFNNNNQFISIYQFDILEGIFKKVNTIDTPFNSFGLDKDENIFVHESAGNLEMYSLKTAASVEVSFKDPSYKYSGDNIETELHVLARSFNGTNIASKMELVAKGPLMFTEGSSKEIIINTLAEDYLRVPVVITGAGNISIYPRILVQ